MSSSKRTVVLMSVLLVVLAGVFAWPHAERLYFKQAAPAFAPPPTAPAPVGENKLTGLTVTQDPGGKWIANVDYEYSGQPRGVMVHVSQLVLGVGPDGRSNMVESAQAARVGKHRISVEIRNLYPDFKLVTEKVSVEFVEITHGVKQLAILEVHQRIQWPDPLVTEVERAIATGKIQAVVDRAVGLIDSEDSVKLGKARVLLELIVEKAPGTDAAFVELARVAMRSNWNATGLREAETLLHSALQIRPDSLNAKVLLGYVHAHQGRYKEAEALFAQAAAGNPPNLWLWANWGEVLAMQGKMEPAIAKYREAIARPPTRDTYDRARWDAYAHLLVLLQRRDDVDGIQALLQQQAKEYPDQRCFAVNHARFLVLQRGDIAAAVAALQEGSSRDCDTSRSREVRGLGYYVAWAQSEGADGGDALRQARALAPVGPNLFYALASTDRGAAVARKLLQSGESLHVRDNLEVDALGYALRNGDERVTRRLLRLGANPVAEQGADKMPAAMIPVLTRDFAAIRLLQRSGVDYRKLRFQGTTAIEVARTQGDTKLEQVLDPKADSL